MMVLHCLSKKKKESGGLKVKLVPLLDNKEETPFLHVILGTLC